MPQKGRIPKDSLRMPYYLSKAICPNCSQGQSKLEQSPWLIEELERTTPPIPFPSVSEAGDRVRPLTGVRVVEMCRIIAGPAIGRTLAEYGADVIKVTPPHLSDVPFFQIDG